MDELLRLTEFDFENLFALTGRDAGSSRCSCSSSTVDMNTCCKRSATSCKAEDYVGARQRDSSLARWRGQLGERCGCTKMPRFWKKKFTRPAPLSSREPLRFAESFEKSCWKFRR